MRKIFLLLLVISCFFSCNESKTVDYGDPIGVWEITNVVSEDETEYTYPYNYTFAYSSGEIEAEIHSYIVIYSDTIYFIDNIESELSDTDIEALFENDGFVDGLYATRYYIDIYQEDGVISTSSGYWKYECSDTTLTLQGTGKTTAQISTNEFSSAIEEFYDYTSVHSNDAGFETLTAESTVTISTKNTQYYKVNLTAGTTYYFYFVSDDYDYSSIYVYTDSSLTYSTMIDLSSIYSNDLIDHDTDYFTPNLNQTYYIKVSPCFNSSSTTLHISTSSGLNTDGFTLVDINNNASINYTGSDMKYIFKADLQANTKYYIGTNSETSLIEPYVYSDGFSQINTDTVSSYKGNFSGLTYLYYFTSKDAGTYYFPVDAYSDSYWDYFSKDTVTFYIWDSKPTTAAEYTLDTEIDVSSGSALIQFDATAGTTYYIYSNDLSNFDFVYYEADETRGSEYADIDIQRALYYETIVPGSTGKTTVDIDSDDSTTNSKLIISESLPAAPTQEVLTIDASPTESSLDEYEKEYYTVDLSSGVQYFIYTESSATSLLSGINGYSSYSLTKNNGSQTIACHRYKTSSACTINITVFGYLEGQSGNYSIKVEADDYYDTLASATYIDTASFSGTAGRLSPTPTNSNYDDEDTFYFTLTGGVTYTIETTGGVDTVGALYNESNTQLLTDSNSGTDDNFLITYTPDSTGTYKIFIDDENDSYGDYTLVITEN